MRRCRRRLRHQYADPVGPWRLRGSRSRRRRLGGGARGPWPGAWKVWRCDRGGRGLFWTEDGPREGGKGSPIPVGKPSLLQCETTLGAVSDRPAGSFHAASGGSASFPHDLSPPRTGQGSVGCRPARRVRAVVRGSSDQMAPINVGPAKLFISYVKHPPGATGIENGLRVQNYAGGFPPCPRRVVFEIFLSELCRE